MNRNFFQDQHFAFSAYRYWLCVRGTNQSSCWPTIRRETGVYCFLPQSRHFYFYPVLPGETAGIPYTLQTTISFSKNNNGFSFYIPPAILFYTAPYCYHQNTPT